MNGLARPFIPLRGDSSPFLFLAATPRRGGARIPASVRLRETVPAGLRRRCRSLQPLVGLLDQIVGPAATAVELDDAAVDLIRLLRVGLLQLGRGGQPLFDQRAVPLAILGDPLLQAMQLLAGQGDAARLVRRGLGLIAVKVDERLELCGGQIGIQIHLACGQQVELFERRIGQLAAAGLRLQTSLEASQFDFFLQRQHLFPPGILGILLQELRDLVLGVDQSSRVFRVIQAGDLGVELFGRGRLHPLARQQPGRQGDGQDQGHAQQCGPREPG